MKTINKIFVLIAILVFVSGCKKIDEKVSKQVSDDREKLIELIKEKYGNLGRGEVYPVNKDADLFYLNPTGDSIKIVKQPGQIYTEGCGLDCTTASDIGELELTWNLVAINRIFDCGNTANSQLIAHWRLSVPYSLSFTNPLPPYQNANAAFRITNSSNVILYSSSTITLTSANMEALGPDPNCTGNYLYYLSYSMTGVDDSYFANGNKVLARMTLYNDCNLAYYNTNTGWTQGAVFSGSTATAGYPCARIDKLWVASSSLTGTNAQALGSYTFCGSFSPGFVATTKNQIQYRARTHATSYNWNDQISLERIPYVNGSFSSTGEISPYGTDLADFIGVYKRILLVFIMDRQTNIYLDMVGWSDIGMSTQDVVIHDLGWTAIMM